MSCLDVMYQSAYQGYQYSFYQRPFAQKFGHYKMQDGMGMDGAVDFSSTSTHHHSAPHTPSLSAFASTANPGHHHHPHFHHPAHYTGHSVGSSASSAGSSQGHSAHSSLHSTPSSLATVSSVLGVKEERESGSVDKGPASEADYVNSRCVIFTFYTGDLDKIVDEHFSRSLSQHSSFSPEGVHKSRSEATGNSESGSDGTNWSSKNTAGCPVTPMCKRNFPPSFWNSNFYSAVGNSNNNTNNSNSGHLNSVYQAGATTGSMSHHDTSSFLSAAAAADSYTMHHRASVHHPQADAAWHYGFGAHHQSSYPHHHHHHHHTGLHELGYGVSPGSAFNPRYSSLLIQPSVRPGRLPTMPGQCDFTKSSTTEWPATYTPHSHHSTTDIPTYSVESGSTIDTHETNKDLYWF
ncbi:transcription cofactor vestigial-like protein 3 [Diadema antillarum]|uniref:transcription cofactor vestigial-like protein 3 n=1 Tax=Diadema antillarum TaxID=105358 RepID=UPI003A847DA2